MRTPVPKLRRRGEQVFSHPGFRGLKGFLRHAGSVGYEKEGRGRILCTANGFVSRCCTKVREKSAFFLEISKRLSDQAFLFQNGTGCLSLVHAHASRGAGTRGLVGVWSVRTVESGL